MRIVLQQKESALYLKDLDAWTRTSSEAKDFLSSTTAMEFCNTHRLKDLQIVLKFDDQKYEIVLPALMSALGSGTAESSHLRV